MEAIKRPDYLHYSRFTTIKVDSAIWLLAAAELSETDFTDAAIYKKTLKLEMERVETVLRNAVEYGGIHSFDEGGGSYLDEYREWQFDPSLLTVDMVDLCEWAVEKNYKLPKELRVHVSDTIIQRVPVVLSNTPRSLLIDSLKQKGIETDLILEHITDTDLNCLNGLITPPEIPDPVNVADTNEKNRQCKVKAINFMLQQIQSEPGCICNHVNLAKVALKYNSWNDIPDKHLSKMQLTEISILIVPPNRRYNTNKKSGPTLYDPTACKCKLPDHKPALLSVKKRQYSP